MGVWEESGGWTETAYFSPLPFFAFRFRSSPSLPLVYFSVSVRPFCRTAVGMGVTDVCTVRGPMISMDNSEHLRNGDYTPTRMEAQQDAASVVTQVKINDNPENTVAVMTTAGKGYAGTG